MAISCHLVFLICISISRLDENETKILRKPVEYLACNNAILRCQPKIHHLINSVEKFTVNLRSLSYYLKRLMLHEAKEGLTSFGTIDRFSHKLNHIYLHITPELKERFYICDAAKRSYFLVLIFSLGNKGLVQGNETLPTTTSLENKEKEMKFYDKCLIHFSTFFHFIATLLCFIDLIGRYEFKVKLEIKHSKIERISIRVTSIVKQSLEDAWASLNESDVYNKEHKKMSRRITFSNVIQTHNNSKLSVYPASAVSLLASYRPLMYMELPNSVFFVQLSSNGFHYPGSGSSVLCVGCENSVDLSLFTSDPSSAIYHKPGCQFIKVGTIETSSHYEGLVNSQSESSQVSETLRTIEHTSNEAIQSSNVAFSEISSVLQTPAYPVYSDSKKRLESFVNWSTDHVHQVNDLVNAGFFYAGYSDCVRCFQCGLGLKSWRPGDHIHTEHERFRPSCAFLKTQISHKSRSNLHNEQVQMTRVQSTRAGSASCGNEEVNINTEDQAHKTVQEQQIDAIQTTVTSELKNTEGLRQSPQEISQKLLQRENEALKHQLKCKSCQTADVQDLFLPCGHMSTCKQCSNKCSQCPVCGKRILGTVNVYFA